MNDYNKGSFQHFVLKKVEHTGKNIVNFSARMRLCVLKYIGNAKLNYVWHSDAGGLDILDRYKVEYLLQYD